MKTEDNLHHNLPSFKDDITGLFNREFLLATLEHEVKRGERYGDSFTVALIDIDDFHLYNTEDSKHSGEHYIREIAQIIEQCIRKADLAARYLNDVFAVLMIKHEPYLAQVAADRIRDAVLKKFGGRPTVSIGLASFPRDATHQREIFERAHDALLEAKKRGGNRTYFFSHEPSTPPDKKYSLLLIQNETTSSSVIEDVALGMNIHVTKVSRQDETFTTTQSKDFDLIIIDSSTDDVDGFLTSRLLKENSITSEVPIIFLCAADDSETRIQGIEAGVDDFINTPLDRLDVRTHIKNLIENKRLTSTANCLEEVLFSIANAVEAKDNCTQGHIERVSHMAVSIGIKLHLSNPELEALKIGSAVHDIGKINTPDEILNKQGPLNPEEWKAMKDHADIGYRICLPLGKNMELALDLIRHHHEKLDGSGYPDGLKGDDISMVSRIMGVVDIYDALITNRPYRRGLSKDSAMQILEQEGEEGKLDKRVIHALAELIRQG